MQTFLPYEDFNKSAKCLDRLRLGKQRVECMQIARTLLGKSEGWKNHPAVKMWRGYEISLFKYWYAIVKEWKSRGYKDTTLDELQKLTLELPHSIDNKPRWLGDDKFHKSHQSNLVRKLPEHYRTYFPDIPNNLEYVWPV